MKQVRVVLAHGQQLARSGLRMLLEVEGDVCVVGEASAGDEAVEVARRTRADVVLVDVALPRVDGVEVTRRLRAERRAGAAPAVLVLITLEREAVVYDVLRAGASGVLLKSAAPSRLLAAVRAVARGETLLGPVIARQVVEQYVGGPRVSSSLPGDLASLTGRELDVLRLLARGHSNAEIAELLVIGGGTVKTHVSRVLSKLGLRDRVQAVVLAYESGLVRPGGATSGRGGT